MESLPVIKLVIDLALAGTVFFLAARVAKRNGPSPTQVNALQNLEQSLSRLMREAGGASSELQSALAKEKKKLEDLLFDIETVEHRVSKGIDQSHAILRDVKRAQTDSEQVQPKGSSAPVIHYREEPQYEASPPAPQREVPQIQVPQREIQTREPQYEEVQARAPQVVSTQLREPVTPPKTVTEAAPVRSAATNIYGDPIGAESPQGSHSLRSEIQREQYQRAPEPEIVNPDPHEQQVAAATPVVEQSLEEIYAQCEQLLKAGSSLQQVSNRMNLSVDEIQTLQKYMEVEDDSAAQTLAPSGGTRAEPTDARLGVLPKGNTERSNPIGRSTQVIS